MTDIPVIATSVQRAGVFAELPVLLIDLGVDPVEVFAGSGIDPLSLSPDSRVPFPMLLQTLDRAAKRTGCAHIGLLCGLRFRLDHHGILGALMRTAATLRQALEDFVLWQPGYSNGAVVFLQPLGRDHALGYGCYAQVAPGTRILYDAILGVGLQMVRQLTGQWVQPVEAHLSSRSPADTAPYGRLLRCTVRFNQHRTALILDEAALHLRLPGADPALRKSILATIRQSLPHNAEDWPTRVRHSLRHALLNGESGMDRVAADLGQHSRTLRRRLAEAGTSFETLRDEIRFATARELLELTDLPMADIAHAVDLASPAVFSETFRRWTGMPPRRWRQTRPWTGLAEGPARPFDQVPR